MKHAPCNYISCYVTIDNKSIILMFFPFVMFYICYNINMWQAKRNVDNNYEDKKVVHRFSCLQLDTKSIDVINSGNDEERKKLIVEIATQYSCFYSLQISFRL